MVWGGTLEYKETIYLDGKCMEKVKYLHLNNDIQTWKNSNESIGDEERAYKLCGQRLQNCTHNPSFKHTAIKITIMVTSISNYQSGELRAGWPMKGG